VIRSFGDKRTEAIWKGELSKKLHWTVQRKARMKLRLIDWASDLHDLRVPPANRLEKLKRELSQFYSIRINKQWRIIFKWEDGNAFEVKIIDYH